MALSGKNRKQITDLAQPVQLSELNRQLDWVWTQLLGGLPFKGLGQDARKMINSKASGAELETAIEQTHEAITLTAQGLSGDISQVEQTAQGLTTRVQSAERTISQVEQTADKINWVVASGDSASNMTLTERLFQLVAAGIDLTGRVTFRSLDTATQNTINGAASTASSAASTANSAASTASSAYSAALGLQNGLAGGTTTIDGGCIKTGYIDARRINTSDLFVATIRPYESSRGHIFVTEGDLTNSYVRLTFAFAPYVGGAVVFEANNGIRLECEGVMLKVNGTHPTSGERGIIVTGNFLPEAGNTYALGGAGSGQRWRNCYLNSGPNVTSDLRMKRDVAELKAAKLLKRLRPIRYRMRADPVKLRFGFGAQDVKEALAGSDYGDAALLDEGNPDSLGLCYEELIAVLVEGWQEHERVIARQQARIEALEARLCRVEGQVEGVSR